MTSELAGPAAGPPPPGRTNRTWIAVLAVAAVVVAGAAVGVVAATRGGGDQVQTEGRASSGAADDPDEEVAVDAPVVSTPAGRVESSGTSDSGSTDSESSIDEPLAAPPPVTTPPTTPPPTTSPSSRSGGPAQYFADPDHLVSFTLPPEMVVDVPFGGTYASWSYDGIFFSYEVQEGAGLVEADDLYATVFGQLVGEPATDSRPPTAAQDGRFIVSGYLPDGTILYVRAKVRCGDLVSYTIRANADGNARVGSAIPNALYSETEEGDAMGGVHATC